MQERRRGLHARIVEALEGLAGGQVGEQVERLAPHALRGEVWDKALVYCRQAGGGRKPWGGRPTARPWAYFEQALSALPHLPEGQPDVRVQAIDLRLALRSALRNLNDFGRVLAYLREAESLACRPRRSPSAGADLGLFVTTLPLMGAHDQAVAAAQRALALATAGGDGVMQALANLTWAEPTRNRATIVGRSTACGRS